MELDRRRKNKTMSLSELNIIGLNAIRILQDISHNSNLILKINDSVFSSIGRPKLACKEHTIWEIPAIIDC